MEKQQKKSKKNVEKWLLMFEELVGKPCVVSLLIQKEEINFVACFNKDRYFDGKEEPDDETPSVDLEKVKKDIKSLQLESKNYIG